MKSEPLIQQTEHNAQKPYKCSDCEKGFTRTYHLENHQSAHWRKKKHFKCRHCEKSFTLATDLTQHDRRHTRKSELVQCSVNMDQQNTIRC